MSSFNNGLTPAQAERFAMLAEECGEVIQMVGKILRHGLDSSHPAEPSKTNYMLLSEEVWDVMAVLSAMGHKGDLLLRDDHGPYSQNASERWNKKVRWTHHQEKV